MDSTPPAVDSVHEGHVVRIEDYGAFVQFAGKWRGLVHISELASIRVEKVTDVVDMDESVWVRVLAVEDTGGRFPKIRLSCKGVPQDGTAPQVMAATQRATQVTNDLEQNLHSTMGMAIARDPMAPSDNRGLILKEPKVIKGYALLLEDEEEEKPPPPPIAPVEVKPMGRGRGLTIPAWMSKQQGGPTGKPADDDGTGNSDRRKKKKSKKKKHHRRRHDSEDEERRRRRRHKKYRNDSSDNESSVEDRRGRRKRRSHYSDDSYNDDDDDSRRRRKHKRRNRDEKHGSRSHRHSSTRHSDSEEEEYRNTDGHEFTSIEEAKRLVAEIEARRQKESQA